MISVKVSAIRIVFLAILSFVLATGNVNAQVSNTCNDGVRYEIQKASTPITTITANTGTVSEICEVKKVKENNQFGAILGLFLMLLMLIAVVMVDIKNTMILGGVISFLTMFVIPVTLTGGLAALVAVGGVCALARDNHKIGRDDKTWVFFWAGVYEVLMLVTLFSIR